MNVECLDFEGMPYVKVYPENHKKGEKHPLLLFLHGAGTIADEYNDGKIYG